MWCIGRVGYGGWDVGVLGGEVGVLGGWGVGRGGGRCCACEYLFSDYVKVIVANCC